VNEVVLDASVVMKWFSSARESRATQARALRDRYERGEMAVVVPTLLFLELLNVAGRRWGWDASSMSELATSLGELQFGIAEAELNLVAAWVARGLTAYDAAYVALAEGRGIALITDDDQILTEASSVATALAAAQ
jgi:predicted nucleic acid-binding protein